MLLHQTARKVDFGTGSVKRQILNLALPMTLAQVVSLLYNLVDRIYIGRMDGGDSLALTSLGLALPFIILVTGFSNLFGTGGSALFSIVRGSGDQEEAARCMGNSFTLLVGVGLLLMLLGEAFKEPLLLLFGASQDTLSMAREYTEIYLLGTVFVMLSLGMNSFINAQGQGALGMATVWIGAILNMVLDPLFIFKLDMGLKGAAIATVLSQMVSAAWTFYVLVLGGHVEIRLRKSYLSLKLDRVKSIVTMGMSGFIMSATNGLVQIVCNTTLQTYGGDVYVGAMTVIGSVRELVSMPVMGLTSSAQPVMGYNYGAKKYDRVREAIRFESVVSIVYTLVVWGILHQFPEPFVRIFNDSPELVKACVPAMKIYYFGFFMMALQFAGQTAFVALGKARQAVIFSILRKGVIVAPLTVLLPRISGIGIHGVFLAEPISNFIGGTACFVTMMITVYRKMSREEISAEKGQ